MCRLSSVVQWTCSLGLYRWGPQYKAMTDIHGCPVPTTYLHLNGHQVHSLDLHFLGLMAHNKRAGAGHLVIGITMVVVNVDPKVVHCGADLLHQHICAVTLETVVETIEGDKVWVPPAGAVACGRSSIN